MATSAVHNQTVDSIPLGEINVANPYLFQNDTVGEYFSRLRREDPVHYCAESRFGPYWSVTKFNDIMAVDTNHKVFSSEAKLGGISVQDMHSDESALELEMFIAMDQPKHDQQRKAVSPVVAPSNLLLLEPVIRERAGAILDALPIGEEIDWVKLVSVELTTMTLATIFDFPWEERAKLTRWSDVTTASPETGIVESFEQRREELIQCAMYFKGLWDQRIDQPGGNDLISMMAHSPATRDMPFLEFLGNLLLLIVGGNDTTRNSISGGVLALNQNPGEYQKLRNNPALVSSMIPEIIRWQTPLTHMRRTALEDVKIGGKQIRTGDKVVMWYLSGNRDDTVIDRAEEFIIDRQNPRHHLSFGFGIHRCMGNRLAELQLRIIWEEILKRYSFVEVVGEPERLLSNLVRGITRLPVKLHAH
ncbi:MULTISPECIES: cytochrome P450 [Sphingomonadaceae]|jgi:cytochrome P450|uniref:cytochrome P450 n=1 Tax=Sphingomonadales TaxID=204457 RepID=UPI00082653E7|nr:MULTISPECIES: cytochrome P450 [Sphingomonadaceae]MAF61917.1 cytochrome P450 [Blastomonas sp.]MBA4045529.1 cytochrome P450 [Erythrobacter sp.]MBA4172112.1 cytochrome P450 [Hyphomicrobium sp.]MBA4079988.1 cytochrome P450 [Erythrobacter sp.]MCW1384645.1 cytochrome P450 [Novosphingobium sp. KCTC 2891]|tara:strand:+ start:12708 stop:13961 length:1254 start_codon:yes stop_codon:yes gene_type:complete